MTAHQRFLTAAAIVAFGLPLMAADSAVVLMYHRFGEDRYPSTNIRVDQFEAQLKFLLEGGYEVVPLAAVMVALNGGVPLPSNAVVITVDDAYRSVYEVAFPRLKASEFPFTVFVSTDSVDQGLPAYMTWEQMREMEAGGACFANHGATHDSLIDRHDGEGDAAWRARVRADISKGWQRLKEELDPLAGAFAYPYGEYNTAVAEVVREMGYMAFGQQSGAIGPSSDRRALPRFPMAEAFGDMVEFRTKVSTLPMPVAAVEPWDPVVSTQQPILEVTLGELDAPLDKLACFVSGQGRVEIEWLLPAKRFRVGPIRSFGEGRHRVNCTAPRKDGRYLWFSHPWIVQPSEEEFD